MARRRIAFLSLVACVALAAGCTTKELAGSLMPGARLSPTEVYYVEKLASDGRGIETAIRDQLEALGKRATSGLAGSAPPAATVLVTYQDRWMWDLRMVLVQLDIQFKNAKTGHVVATGKMFRKEFKTMSPDEMASEVLAEIFAAGDAK
jgi:hypothetical protein